VKVDGHRGGRGWRVGLTAAAGLVAVALALVLLLPEGTRTPGGGTLGAQPATAAQVGARVATALARIDALSAVLVVRGRTASDAPLRTTRSRLWLTSAGDERVQALGRGGGRDAAYDAATGTEVVVRDPGVPGSSVTRGLAPGPPDRPASDRAVQRQLGGVARALRAAGAAPVRAVSYDGRPAWRIAVAAAIDVHALPGDTGDRVEITVDRASGLPLRVRETFRGRFVAERRLERVRIDPRIPAGTFTPDPAAVPQGQLDHAVDRFDAGFRRRPFAQARAAVGYAPLAPRALPAGFARAETAVAVTTPFATGAEGMNPPSRDVVSTAYRRGLDAVVVSTRRVGGDPRAWADPLAAPEGFLVRSERVCFRAGALAGSCGQLLVDPRATPHVWAIAGGLVVTVAGDLTRGELLRAAGSLAPAP
jgi:hypothetical protein